jgi:hypothetical protein
MQNLEDFYDKNPDATIDELYSAAMDIEPFKRVRTQKAEELNRSGSGYVPSEQSKAKRTRIERADTLNKQFPGAGITPDMGRKEIYQRITDSGGAVTVGTGAFINEGFPEK